MLHVILEDVVDDQRSPRGLRTHSEPMVVDLGNRREPRKRQGQVQEVTAKKAETSRHLVLGDQRSQTDVFAVR